MAEGERPEQPINQAGKPDLLTLRNELPQPIVDVGRRLGTEQGHDALYPLGGRYGWEDINDKEFYDDVFTAIRGAAEKGGKEEEFTTLPEMPKVEQLVQEGSITAEDAELYKKRLVSLLNLEPVLTNPANLSQYDLQQFRTGFLALSNKITTRHGVYDPDHLKDTSPELLIALARLNLAREIVAKGEHVDRPFVQPNTWPVDYALTPEEANALEIRFPDSYKPDGYLRKAADVFKESQIVLKGNIKYMGDIYSAAHWYKHEGGEPNRSAFLQSLGYTPEDINVLTPQAQQTVDSLLSEKR